MKIKICGMKYKDNIESVALLQPDYLGFIFYRGSKRYFDGEMPTLSTDIKKIGVFVNEKASVISDLIQKFELDGVQLHGDESPDFCARNSTLASCGILKTATIPCGLSVSETDAKSDASNSKNGISVFTEI